jgi:peptidoglycan/xylan/chitin deacetylase (PgdA/CDA1 family)
MIDSLTSRIFLSAAQRRLMAAGTPVLMYHYLGRPPDGSDPYLYVSPESFRAQCRALRHAGFESCSLSDLAEGIERGLLPPKRVVITIDDGARNFFEHGMAALQEAGLRAIMFVVAEHVGGINEWDAKHGRPVVSLMDDRQIREWLAAGHEIGSHTLTHRNLAKLDEAEARRQIFDSKQRLEDRFGVEIRHFCYPHGRFTDATGRWLREAGYETGCTTLFGTNGARENRFALRRIQPLSSGELLGKSFHRLRQRFSS